jgi:hypothetical protein
MTYQDIIDATRRKLDDLVDPFLWSDDDLIDALNQALSYLVTNASLLHSDRTMPVTAGSSVITVDKSIFGILSCKFNTSILQKVDYSYLVNLYSIIDIPTTDIPQLYHFDNVSKQIFFYPIPKIDGTLFLRTQDTIFITVSNLNTSIAFEESWQPSLVDGVCAFAYRKADTEVYDRQIADSYLQRFNQWVEYLKQKVLLQTQSYIHTTGIPRGLL